MIYFNCQRCGKELGFLSGSGFPGRVCIWSPGQNMWRMPGIVLCPHPNFFADASCRRTFGWTPRIGVSNAYGRPSRNAWSCRAAPNWGKSSVFEGSFSTKNSWCFPKKGHILLKITVILKYLGWLSVKTLGPKNLLDGFFSPKSTGTTAGWILSASQNSWFGSASISLLGWLFQFWRNPDIKKGGDAFCVGN